LIAIAIAELGDKTQLSVLLLSSKTTKHLQIFFGVLLAFLIVDGVAIAAGSWITMFIPVYYLKIVSGLVFILFGILILMNKDDEEEKTKSYQNPFITSFFLILLTEWGDKTQIAAALFATRFNPVGILIGSMIALSILSVIAIFFGKLISERISKATINRVAAAVFILMGLAFLLL
jgi:Ca2+/H+ antiporter, TMEM165/GDT1 family